MQPMRIEHLILRYGTKFRARKELYFVPKQMNVSESEKSKVFIVCDFVGASKISYVSPCSSVDRALASGARSRRFESFQGHKNGLSKQ